MADMTRDELEHIRRELRMNGKKRKGKLHEYLKAKNDAKKIMESIAPQNKNYRINNVTSIKDILGKI